MKAEIDNLSALLVHSLEKNILVPVSEIELLAALDAIESALDLLPVKTHDTFLIQDNLNKGYEVLSNLLYYLFQCRLATKLKNTKCLEVCTTALLKKITDVIKWYSHVPGHSHTLLPPKNLYRHLCNIKDCLNQNSETGQLQGLLNSYFPNPRQVKMLPYHLYQWWCQFAHYMVNNNISTLQSFEDTLILLNCNLPGVVNWLSEGIKQQLDDKVSIPEKLEFLSTALIKFTLRGTAVYSYLPAHKSVKETMMHVLQTWMHCLANQRVAGTSAAGKQQPLKLNTALSVPQLALLVRLMTDTKIINETNCTALLKNVASVFSTSKAPSVSAESLRINYYTPGNAAKNIVKDYLINMVTLLRTYQ